MRVETDAMRKLANLHWVVWLRSIGRVQKINVHSSLDSGRVDKVLRGRRYKLKFKRGRDSGQAGLPPRIPGFAGYGGNPQSRQRLALGTKVIILDLQNGMLSSWLSLCQDQGSVQAGASSIEAVERRSSMRCPGYREPYQTGEESSMKLAHGDQGLPKPRTQMHGYHMDDNSVPLVEDGEGAKRGRRDRLLLHRASVSGGKLGLASRQGHGRRAP